MRRRDSDADYAGLSTGQGLVNRFTYYSTQIGVGTAVTRKCLGVRILYSTIPIRRHVVVRVVRETNPGSSGSVPGPG